MASGSLVRVISAIALAGYGVNILYTSQPGQITPADTAKVGVVGDFPWGPTDTPTDIASTGELFETFCPKEFGAANSYVAMRAFLNKTFGGGLKVVRIDAGSSAKAAKTFQDATPVNSVTVTAKYKGALGNSIKIAWSANATTGANRDMTVSIGTTYSKLYKNVVVASGSVVTDPGDPFVVVTKHASYAAVPAVASATSLTGGSDGTATAADYSGTAPACDGIRAFYPDSQKIGILFVAEPPSALIEDINTALKLYRTDTNKGIVVLCGLSTADQTASEAITYAATMSNNQIMYPYMYLTTPNAYDSARAEISTNGNSWIAAALSLVAPETSIGGAIGKTLFAAVTGVEDDLEASTYDDLIDGGVAAFFMESTLGCIVRGAVATDGSYAYVQRMAEFIATSIAAQLVEYQEKPIDIDLANQKLGPVTSLEYATCVGFLQQLLTDGRISSFDVDMFSGNTTSSIAANRLVILINVAEFGIQSQIVLQANIGPSVVTRSA